MKIAVEPTLIDQGKPIITREVVGDDIVLFCKELAVAVIGRHDAVSRDVAVASLLRLGLGLTTDRIAELCGASHGHVCGVRKRLRAGGIAAVLASSGKQGPPRQLTARQQERLKELQLAGSTRRMIAKDLAISMSLAAKEIQRLGAATIPHDRGEKGALAGCAERAAQPANEPKASAPGSQAAAKDGAPVEPSASISGDDGAIGAPIAMETVPPVPAQSPALGAGTDAPCVADNGDVDAVLAGILAIEEESGEEERQELRAGGELRSGPTEHPCRYAGMLLLCAAAKVIGVDKAVAAAQVVRPENSVYSALQALLALMASWGAGYRSLEAMHERDPRSMGVLLGLERSPSVRTLHRAVSQMSESFDPSVLNAELMRGLAFARTPERLWFGADGHFKAYSGEAPIDKGHDAKRRIASKGLADILVTDERGCTWGTCPVNAGDALSQHVLSAAHKLRDALGDARPIAIALDRGGFNFDALNALAADGFGYAVYVPGSVTLPDLSTIAPLQGGVGEILWTHPRLNHTARLIVERDGEALIPVATNQPTLVDAIEVINELRVRRGAQENSIKSARAFVNIDALVDRGGATLLPDDRLVHNPARAVLKEAEQVTAAKVTALSGEHATPGVRSRASINKDFFWAQVEAAHIHRELRTTPAKVSRISLEPEAERAVLKTQNRLLLQPIKFATDNARRWLRTALGFALAPSDHDYDQDAVSRTLLALLRAPGMVRFDDDVVHVTLDFPLAPTSHARIAAALEQLDAAALRFTDAHRKVWFRLAPRPTRDTLYGAAETL